MNIIFMIHLIITEKQWQAEMVIKDWFDKDPRISQLLLLDLQLYLGKEIEGMFIIYLSNSSGNFQ